MSAEQLDVYDGYSALARDVQEERAVRTLARKLGLIVLRKEDVLIASAQYDVDAHTLEQISAGTKEEADEYLAMVKLNIDQGIAALIARSEDAIDRTFTVRDEDDPEFRTRPFTLHHEIAIIKPRRST